MIDYDKLFSSQRDVVRSVNHIRRESLVDYLSKDEHFLRMFEKWTEEILDEKRHWFQLLAEAD